MKLRNTFRVGIYRCALTYYSTGKDLRARWSPDLPARPLSDQEKKQYRSGRDVLLAEVGKATGSAVDLTKTPTANLLKLLGSLRPRRVVARFAPARRMNSVGTFTYGGNVLETKMEMKKMKIKMKDAATATELGRWLGLTGEEVDAHAGVMVRGKAGGTYQLKQSVQAFCAHVRKAASGRGSPVVVARRRLLSAQADLAVTRSQVDAGELLDAAQVEAGWSGVCRSTMASTMAVTTRIAAQCAHLTRKDIAIVEDVIREKLNVAADAASIEGNENDET